MSAMTMRPQPTMVGWLVMSAALISLPAVLGSVASAPAAAAGVVPVIGSSTSSARSTNAVTAYVVSEGSGTVTPIATATNTADPQISVGEADDIAITPDGKTAYVTRCCADDGGTVTPITTALAPTPHFVAITPDGKTVYEGYAKLSLKKYRPKAARNEDGKVFNGLL
jgi:DNA-binding beta-propeller fold protein YncE